jgi:hypothetical protein
MKETFTSGSVGRAPGNRRSYPDPVAAPTRLRPPPPPAPRRQPLLAGGESGSQLGVGRLCAVWTGGSEWGSMALQGFAGAAASRRPVSGKLGEEDFKRHFTVRRGEIHRCGAHLTYGLTLRGLCRTRISLGEGGPGQWEVEQRPAEGGAEYG